MARTIRNSILTVRGIAALKPGEWAADPGAKGAGRLQVRRLQRGNLAWYYRYTGLEGERVRLAIGSGLNLVEARVIAAQLSKRYQSGERDLREALEAEHRETARQLANAEQTPADTSANVDRATTLGTLLCTYVAHLRRKAKNSARDVETTFIRHVKKPWPFLWTTPARDVAIESLLEVIARVVDAGKLREAAKLRSFIRSAYSAAIAARQDANAMPEMRALMITTNPARDLATIDGNTKAGKRALSIAELQAYWSCIANLDAPAGPLLRFHLLTGGQRIAQLQRLTRRQIDEDTKSMHLLDIKGRRKNPRIHDVPLIPAAIEALEALAPQQAGTFVFTATNGLTGAGLSVMRDAIATVVKMMTEADQLPGGRFTARDIRRTVETRLAAAGVPLEVRGDLQSHGLGGVQQRHYDQHAYADEKLAALEILAQIAFGETTSPSNAKQQASTPYRDAWRSHESKHSAASAGLPNWKGIAGPQTSVNPYALVSAVFTPSLPTPMHKPAK